MSDISIPANSVMVTCTAPVNIAVIKYWGKRDTKLILPINSSLSGTIDQGSMRSRTTIIASPEYKEDVMLLNGKEEDVHGSKRLSTVLKLMRERVEDFTDETGKVVVTKDVLANYKVKIISDNNFPTAAGLASSASGFACFTKCLAELFNVKEKFVGELSSFARQGSGSACRSLYGGWVKWVKGEQVDGSDSYAVQVADEHHWPEMRVLILVAHDGRKEVSSTSGMETSVQTSELLAYRADKIVEPRLKEMEDAILAKDFAKFAELTIKDSNQFHAVCLDTYPPIFYMNQTSKRIVQILSELNEMAIKAGNPPVAAYTYDAGPNAVIYCLDEHLEALTALFTSALKPKDADLKEWLDDPLQLTGAGQGKDLGAIPEEWKKYVDTVVEGEVIHKAFVSKVGPGPITTVKKATF